MTKPTFTPRPHRHTRGLSAILYTAIILAMCVALSSCQKKEAPNAATSPAADAAAVACDGAAFQGQCVDRGSTVTFGKFPQTAVPIEWIVLDVVPKSENEGGRILMLSKYEIEERAYDMSHKNADGGFLYPTWAESDIRKWLNDTSDSGFLATYFTAQDLSRIVEVTNKTSDYTYNDSIHDGGIDTKDKVFLLDRKEAENAAYFANDSARWTVPPDLCSDNRIVLLELAFDENGNQLPSQRCDSSWWLRSPGQKHTWNPNEYAAIVDDDGEIDSLGRDVNEVAGVRPAIWVQY